MTAPLPPLLIRRGLLAPSMLARIMVQKFRFGMPYWPRDRFLELAPAYWAQTRVRLDPLELEAELGFVTVPPVLADTAEQAAAG